MGDMGNQIASRVWKGKGEYTFGVFFFGDL